MDKKDEDAPYLKTIYFTIGEKLEQAEFWSDSDPEEVKGKHYLLQTLLVGIGVQHYKLC